MTGDYVSTIGFKEESENLLKIVEQMIYPSNDDSVGDLEEFFRQAEKANEQEYYMRQRYGQVLMDDLLEHIQQADTIDSKTKAILRTRVLKTNFISRFALIHYATTCAVDVDHIELAEQIVATSMIQ